MFFLMSFISGVAIGFCLQGWPDATTAACLGLSSNAYAVAHAVYFLWLVLFGETWENHGEPMRTQDAFVVAKSF